MFNIVNYDLDFYNKFEFLFLNKQDWKNWVKWKS